MVRSRGDRFYKWFQPRIGAGVMFRVIGRRAYAMRWPNGSASSRLLFIMIIIIIFSRNNLFVLFFRVANTLSRR